MYKNLVLIILFFGLLIVGCSSTSSSPKEIRSEIWDNANMIYEALEVSMNNEELLGDYEYQIFEGLYRKYIEEKEVNLTKEEFELLEGLNEMVRRNYRFMMYKDDEEDPDVKVIWFERYIESRDNVSSILNK